MCTSSKGIIAVAIICLLWPAAASADLQLISIPSASNTSTEDAGTLNRFGDLFGHHTANDAGENPATSPQADTGAQAVQTYNDPKESFFYDDSVLELLIYFPSGQEDNDPYRTLWIPIDLNALGDNSHMPRRCVSSDAQGEIKCDLQEVLTVDGLRNAEYSSDTVDKDAAIWENTGGVSFQRMSGYGSIFRWGFGSFGFPWPMGYDFDQTRTLSTGEPEPDTVGLGIDQVTPEPFPSVGSGFGPIPPAVPETPTFAMLLLSLAAVWFTIQRRKGPPARRRPSWATVGLPP